MKGIFRKKKKQQQYMQFKTKPPKTPSPSPSYHLSTLHKSFHPSHQSTLALNVTFLQASDWGFQSYPQRRRSIPPRRIQQCRQNHDLEDLRRQECRFVCSKVSISRHKLTDSGDLPYLSRERKVFFCLFFKCSLICFSYQLGSSAWWDNYGPWPIVEKLVLIQMDWSKSWR